MFLGLRTVIYPAVDLEAATEWWSSVLGKQPYFEQPFYVGFEVGGYELGLDPGADPDAGPITYWGVASIEDALGTLMGGGAQPHSDIAEVGEGIKVAAVMNPQGCIVGVIENPYFRI